MGAEKESLIGVKWVIEDGKKVLKQEVRFSDGQVRTLDVSSEGPDNTEFEERFKDTLTVPADLPINHTSALVRKTIAKETVGRLGTQEFIEEHIQRALSIHAILIKILGTPETLIADGEPIIIKNTALKETVLDLIEAIGDPWTTVSVLIK